MLLSQTITGHFDGKSIVPDEPLQIVPGRKLRVRIETIESEDYPLTQIGDLATDMGVTDLSERHTEYARPKSKGPKSQGSSDG